VRKAEKRFMPVMTFKNGKRFECDLGLGQAESNWFMQFAEDHVPAEAGALSDRQRTFLSALATNLSNVEWEVATPQSVDIEKAIKLQNIFHAEREAQNLPLKEALRAVYSSFMDNHFTMQVGLLLLRLERPFALQRLRDVAGQRSMAA
jgi:dihydroorotase